MRSVLMLRSMAAMVDKPLQPLVQPAFIEQHIELILEIQRAPQKNRHWQYHSHATAGRPLWAECLAAEAFESELPWRVPNDLEREFAVPNSGAWVSDETMDSRQTIRHRPDQRAPP